MCNDTCYFSAGVTIGFQPSNNNTITEDEVAGSVHVCAAIKCGCVRRDVEVNLFSEGNTATGMMWITVHVCMICCWTRPHLLLCND